MTAADILALALDFAYLGVLVIAVNQYRRRPEPVGLAVVAVFLAVFVLFAFSGLGRFVPQFRTVTGVSAFAAFLALPVLTINLVRHFQQVPDWLIRSSAGVAVLLGLGAVVVVLAVVPAVARARTPGPSWPYCSPRSRSSSSWSSSPPRGSCGSQSGGPGHRGRD